MPRQRGKTTGDKALELISKRQEILIEPATIGVIIAAISAVVSYLDDMAKLAAAKEANAKLDLLISIALQILEEIRHLRIVIREELERAFRNDDIRTLDALRKDVGDLIAAIRNPGRIPPAVRAGLEAKFDEVKTLTYKMQGYGYAAYGAVIAGSLLTLQIGILLRLDRALLRSVYKNLRDYFTRALVDRGGAANESPVEVLRNAVAQETVQWGYIDGFPMRGWLGYFEWEEHFPGEDGGNSLYHWVDWYLALRANKPRNIEGRKGFRFDAENPYAEDSERGPGNRSPSYPALVPGMQEYTKHYDGALDGRASVLRWINGKCQERDENWATIVGLRELKANVEQVIIDLDKIARHIR